MDPGVPLGPGRDGAPEHGISSDHHELSSICAIKSYYQAGQQKSIVKMEVVHPGLSKNMVREGK